MSLHLLKNICRKYAIINLFSKGYLEGTQALGEKDGRKKDTSGDVLIVRNLK